MARWKTCPVCDGRGLNLCWLCDGSVWESAEEDGPEEACLECIDGTEPCEECNATGGWYVD